MTIAGHVLALFCIAGLLWLAMLAAVAAIVNLDLIYAVLSAVLVACALALLWGIAREKGVA